MLRLSKETIKGKCLPSFMSMSFYLIYGLFCYNSSCFVTLQVVQSCKKPVEANCISQRTPYPSLSLG